MSNINQFIGQLKQGLARPNRFRVIFGGGDEKVSIFCHTCTLPMRSMETFTHKTHVGPSYKAPYSGMYDSVTFSFYADRRLNTRRFFDRWQQRVTNVDSNTNNYMIEFVENITIQTLDKEGKVGYTVRLIDAWPINVSAVDMSYGSNNQVMNVSVTISYRLWKAR